MNVAKLLFFNGGFIFVLWFRAKLLRILRSLVRDIYLRESSRDFFFFTVTVYHFVDIRCMNLTKRDSVSFTAGGNWNNIRQEISGCREAKEPKVESAKLLHCVEVTKWRSERKLSRRQYMKWLRKMENCCHMEYSRCRALLEKLLQVCDKY